MKNKLKKISYRQDIKLHLIATDGIISYGDAVKFAEVYKVKLNTINRFLQNDSQADRDWKFTKLDIVGKKSKKNAPWFFKKMSKKTLKALKKEMSTTILNKIKK